MIEYLLVLIITVTLVIAVSRGVGNPLQNYIQQNVLDLVGCMLRVGQFPTQSFGLCQAALEAEFDVDGNIENINSGNGSSGNNNNNSSDDAQANNDNQERGQNNGTSGNNGPRVRSQNSNGSINESGGGGPDGSDTQRLKVATNEVQSDEIPIRGGQNFNEPTVVVRRINLGDGQIGGSFSINRDPKAKKEAGVVASSVTSQRTPRALVEPNSPEVRFGILKPAPRSYASEVEEKKVGFSFVGTIKWIIIIAALLFILVFAGSQLNSIRKGWTN